VRALPQGSKSGKNNFAILQAEDELAAIGSSSARAGPAPVPSPPTAGPGISLITSFSGSPTTRNPGRPGGRTTGRPVHGNADPDPAADLLLCAYASHGDTKHILLFPAIRPSASSSP